MSTDNFISIKDAKPENTIGILVRLDSIEPNCEEFKALQNKADQNGYSLLKQILIDSIVAQLWYLTPEWVKAHPNAPVLTITLACGHKVEYKTLDDIPDESAPCSCGNSQHWFLKYEQKDNIV